MTGPFTRELREQARGVVGALLVVGVSMTFTMETWWHGWQLSAEVLLAYALVGLGIVMAVVRAIGFRETEEDGTDPGAWTVVTDFTQLLLQSFVTAYLVLLLLGIVEFGTSVSSAVRLGLVLVVPLAFGAATANELLASTDAEADDGTVAFPGYLATFTLGALRVRDVAGDGGDGRPAAPTSSGPGRSRTAA